MKIFCWVNETGREYHHAVAIDETGRVLAEHVSSSERWARHDIGMTSSWKHDLYAAAHPDGYELAWVDAADLDTHEGLADALAKNAARGEEAS